MPNSPVSELEEGNLSRLLDPVSDSRTARLRKDELFEKMRSGSSPNEVSDVTACKSGSCIGHPVDMGMHRLRIFTSIDQALDEIRLIEGEDDFTGTVPVLEAMIDLGFYTEEDHIPATMQTEYKEGEYAQLLSSFPAEGLDAIFHRMYGKERWWTHDPLVLIEDLVDLAKMGNIVIDAGGLNLVNALHSFLSAPAGSCAFFRDPSTFYAMTLWLNGRSTKASSFLLPAPLEMARALHIALTLRPEVYQKSVFSAIAVACFDAGLWVLPGILKAAQPEMNEMCRNLGVDVTDEVVRRIQDLAERERADPTTIEDVTNDPEEIQALRCLEIERALVRENEHALFLRDRLLTEE